MKYNATDALVTHPDESVGERPAPPSSMRLTPSESRRLENMRLVVAELAIRDMQACEFSLLLGVSASKIRRYIVELCGAKVICVFRRT